MSLLNTQTTIAPYMPQGIGFKTIRKEAKPKIKTVFPPEKKNDNSK